MTTGESIANAILPFAYSKHTLGRDEYIKMVSKQIDREIGDSANLVLLQGKKIELMQKFIRGEGVVIDGVAYRKDINADSFLKAINKLK